MRVAYFYLMGDSARVPIVTAAHAKYWTSLKLQGYEGGPFADLSGGLIVFDTDSLATAEQYVAADPFVAEDVLASRSLKHWIPATVTKEVVA